MNEQAELRGTRLQTEYLEAEAMLQRHGVRHAILVLGSARAVERTRYYPMAREFGRLVGEAGGAVMTGGGPGIMEAANRGASEANAPSIGLNITLPDEQKPNAFLTPGLSLRFRYFALRKLHFLLRARALAAFPGGFGTLDELFEALTLVQTRKIRALPIVLVGRSYWERAVDMDFLLAEGAIHPRDRELFAVADSARQAWDAVAGWYRARGEAVFPA